MIEKFDKKPMQFFRLKRGYKECIQNSTLHNLALSY